MTPGFPSVTSSFSEVIASKENIRTALRKEVAQLKKSLTEKANLVSILEATNQRSDKEQDFDDQAEENEKVGKGQGRKERISRKDAERDQDNQDENEESTKADDEKGWASFGGPHLVRKRSWPSSKHEDGADVNPAEAKDTREDEDVVAELIPQHAPVFPETTFLLGAEPMYAFLYFLKYYLTLMLRNFSDRNAIPIDSDSDQEGKTMWNLCLFSLPFNSSRKDLGGTVGSAPKSSRCTLAGNPSN